MTLNISRANGRLNLAKTSVSPVTAYLQGLGIVTDGMVLNLDAGTPLSYPGSGTTWTDLSGNGNNGTLTNGPTYSSSNGGSIVFDGVNDYTSTNYFLSNSAASILVWFNALTQTSDSASILRPIIQQGNFSGDGTFPEGIEINMIRSGSADVGKIRVAWGNATNTNYYHLTTSRYDNSQWYMVTLSNDGTNFSFYINENLIATKQTYTSVSTATNLQIGGSTTISARKFKGNIPQVSIYNRALTATEIQQNFNAMRGRFNI